MTWFDRLTAMGRRGAAAADVIAIFVFATALVLLSAYQATAATRVAPAPDAIGLWAPENAARRTDVNLITAVDVSGSISRRDEWLQLTGLSRAVVHPDFLALLRQGYFGRVGFVLYTWSSDNRYQVVVPWTTIATVEDAERVSKAIAAVRRIDRSGYENGQDDGAIRSFPIPFADARTDISMAIEFGTSLAATAPLAATHTVINICSDGTDNAGAQPLQARDRAMSAGYTINGVVFGNRRDVPGFFENYVAGGPGAFVMVVDSTSDMRQSLERKFLRDLIAALEARPPRSPLPAPDMRHRL